VLSGRIDFPRHFDLKGKDLIKRLLTADRAKRFGCLKNGAEDIQRHKWYKHVDWHDLAICRAKPFYVPAVRSADDTTMFDRYPESMEESAPPLSEEHQQLFSGFGEV